MDTTLLIQLQKKPDDARSTRLALAPYRFKSTSTYARYEFNRTWIQDLAWLHKTCFEVEDVADLLGATRRAFGVKGGPHNRLVRTIEAIERFLKLRGGADGAAVPGGLSPRAELLRMREQIAYAATQGHVAWDRSIDHEYDGTGCTRARVRPRLAPNDNVILKLPNCRRERIECRIHRFFDGNREHFSAIALTAEELGEAASPQLRQTAAHIRAAEGDPTDLCDNRKCAKVGDALIAVDGLAHPVYGANNDSEWIPISRALGKELLNPLRRGPRQAPDDGERTPT